MDYVLKPSLESMALTKIAIALWDQDDAMEREAEDEVVKKVPRLLLPEPLNKKVVKFVSGIGREILIWKRRCHQEFELRSTTLSDLCWTPHGTVDTKRTAEAFIQNEDIDVTSRYRVACDYCLEDDIPKLWDKIPEDLREEFNSTMEPDYLVVLWTYQLKGKVDKLDRYKIERRWGSFRSECSPYQYAFEYAADRGNKAATEYFFPRLTHEEREVSLVTLAKLVARKGGSSWALPSDLTKVLCFLFSQMDEQEQVEVFKEHPHHVLSCLLEWPWQSLFMKTANRLWDFLSEENFHKLLSEIMFSVNEDYGDYNYQKLFVEFWQQSHNTHKKYFIGLCKRDERLLLSALSDVKHIDYVRLILNSATVEERKDIIFCPEGTYIFEGLLHANKWDSVKLVLQECLSSKEVIIEFKEEFKKRIEHRMSIFECTSKYEWDKFFQVIDDLIQDNNNKRSVGEAGEST